MRTNIDALNGIRTHGLSVKVIKAYASDRAAAGTGPATNDFLHGTVLTLDTC
jgi:hypothetical protein